MFKYLIRKAGIPVLIFGFLSATVFADDTDTLSARQQAIIPIAAHTASGDIAALNTALADGLDAGLTVNEIKEIFIHAYAYVGFPRALNGINAFNRVVDNRKSNGINDKLGKSATPVPENFDDNGIFLIAQPVMRLLSPPSMCFWSSTCLPISFIGMYFQQQTVNLSPLACWQL